MDEISLTNLEDVSKLEILKKPILFQGEQFILEEVENICVDKYLIQELFGKEEYILGKNIKYCNNTNPNYIARNIINSKSETFFENELLLRAKKKILVIADIAGSGKTYLLHRLAYILKKSHPLYCVINLDLQSINQFFNEKNNNSTFTDYICFYENIYSNFGKNIIKSLKKYIFIDGIDEINVKNRTKLIDFLKANISEITNIVICTKKYNFILQEIATVADLELYNLQFFSLNEQLELVNNYFNSKCTENLLNFFQQINCMDLKILLIPLGLIMLAEMCFNETMNLNSIKDMNIYDFYNMYYSYLRSNLKTTKNTNIMEVLDIFNELDLSERIFEIRNLVDDPKMKHESFHDYFVIQHLWSLIIQKDKKILQEILEKVFLNNECLSICTLFNSMLESLKPTHQTTLSAVSNLYNSIVDEISWDQENNLINLVSNNCLNIIKLIFDNYKDCSKIIGIKDSKGITALHLSIWNQNIFKYFLQKGADLNDNIEIFSLILLSCCNNKILLKPPNLMGIERCLSFLNSIYLAQLNEKQIIGIFTYLKTIKANVNIQDQNECNLLHYAAALNLPETFKFFVENIQLELLSDKLGRVPQYFAAKSNALEVLKCLKTLNMDFNVRDNNGNTLVHGACLGNSLEVLHFLINDCKMALDCSNSAGSTPQHYAAMGNALEVLKYLKTLNVDFNVKSKTGKSLVHIACLYDSFEILKFLVNECKVTLDCSNNDGFTPQHFAAQRNSLEIIKYFKTLNVDFNVRNKKGDTLVHRACLHNSLVVLQFLLNDCKLTVDCSNSTGSTPQHFAAAGNALDVIKYLNMLNVGFNVRNNIGETVVHVACLKDSLEVLQYLVNECKVTLDCSDDDGITPQHYAVEGNALEVLKYLKTLNVDFNVTGKTGIRLIHLACLNNSFEILKFLVNECKVTLDCSDDDGLTPQHYAVQRNSLEVLKYLKTLNVDFNVQTKNGDTLVHRACLRNSLEVLQFLLNECKVTVDCSNSTGCTPQHFAAAANALNVIKYLNMLNVGFNVRNNTGETVVHIACLKNSLEVLQYLVNECKVTLDCSDDDGITPQHFAVEGNALEVLKYLKTLNVDFNVKSKTGKRLVHIACINNSFELLKFLVNECKVTLDCSDDDGLTPQHYAVEGNALEVLKYLKTLNVDFNVRNKKGDTLVHRACLRNSLEVLQFLLNECKLTIDCSNSTGSTPQHFAAAGNALDVIKYLNTLNVGFNVRNNIGETVVHVACLRDSLEVLQYLVNECKVTLDCSDDDGITPQHFAAQRNSLEVLKYLKTLNVDFNVKTNNGDTLVHTACLNNSVDVLQFLLNECKMTLDCPNNLKKYPQHSAALGNSLEVIKYLKKLNANFNVLNREDYTPLHLACYGKDSLTTVKYFVEECNLRPDQPKSNETLCSHLAAFSNSLTVLKYLIDDCNIDINVRNEYGSYIQHHAARGNSLDVIIYLKNRNVDLNVTDYKGHTLLHRAAMDNSLDVFKYLIEDYKMNANVVSQNGSYPQHHAATGNALEIIEYFIENNFNLNVLDKYGCTIVHRAASHDSLEVLKYLVENCKMNINVPNKWGEFPQHQAAKFNAINAIKYLVSRGIDLNLRFNGQSLLHIAARYDSIDVVKYLVEECNMNVEIYNRYNQTPIDSATRMKSPNVFDYFKTLRF